MDEESHTQIFVYWWCIDNNRLGNRWRRLRSQALLIALPKLLPRTRARISGHYWGNIFPRSHLIVWNRSICKLPPFVTSSKYNPSLALQIHFKVFSTHNAIHLFERLYRLHSCPTVTDFSSRQGRDGHYHFTRCWTDSPGLRIRTGRMVCGIKGLSESTVPS